MIQPTYVTFEQAKLLKLKEFDIPCRYLYVAGKYRINNEREGYLYDNGIPSIQIPNDWCFAPEQWQLVEWLRVKHGIWVVVDCDVYGELWHTELKTASKTVWENLKFRQKIIEAIFSLGEHKTPQEAYSAAFDYILKELI